MTVTAQYLAEHFEEVVLRLQTGEELKIIHPGSNRILRTSCNAEPVSEGDARREAEARNLRRAYLNAVPPMPGTPAEVQAEMDRWHEDDREMWAEWERNQERLDVSAIFPLRKSA